jgi:D-alanyl-D-alanine carboxypeptidase (penicillin-binding protein 5/6)
VTPLRLTALLVSAALIGPAIPAAAFAAPVSHAPYVSYVDKKAEIPCPTAKVNPQPAPPAPSPVPTHDPTLPAVGGTGLATTGLAVPAGTPAVPTNVSATTWVVADLDTGEVIGACNPHQYSAPASIQKLLLVATVMPKLKAQDKTVITQEDLNFEQGSSSVGLILGGTYSVETLWLGLLLNSGNDAANTLARLGGGDRGVKGTLADMNAEAKKIGAFDTHAETPSGLDGPGQVTSSYDMALIARVCFAREDFRKYASSRSAQIPPQPPKDPKGYQIQNDNTPLLTTYPGAMGGKTGFTDIARHTFVGAADRGGRRLVVTMLNGEHLPVRQWQQGAALLDWGFSVPKGSSVGRLVEPGEADARLAKPTASASAAAPAPVMRAAAAGPLSHRTTMMVGAGTAVAFFVGVWFLVILRTRHTRRARVISRKRT